MTAQTGRKQYIDLGYRPRQHQSEMHRKRARFTVAVLHRRAGKTIYAIMELIDHALRATSVNPRFGYIAPFRNQAKAIAWDYLKHYALKVPGTKVNEGELWVEFPNNARIRLFGADNADAMRGQYFDGVVMDEVADMRPIVWGEIVRPALADRRGWALFIGTPKGINLFSELYFGARDGFRDEVSGELVADPEWCAFIYTIDDTQALSPDEVSALKATLSDAEYRQELLCDFSAAADNVLISLDLVSESMKRDYKEADIAWSPRIMGVDVAYYGDDRTVIACRQGLAVRPLVEMRKQNPLEVAGRVIALAQEWRPSAIFVDDTGGYGAGVIARLRELGHNVIGVNFASEPDDKRFKNKRAEMWVRLRDWMRDGGSIPSSAELRADLSAPTYKVGSDGRIQLEPKDKIKERGLRSPDYADALALTFAFDVVATAQDRDYGFINTGNGVDYDFSHAAVARAAMDYNPFA